MDEVDRSSPDALNAFLTFAVMFSILAWIPAAAIGIMLLVASRKQLVTPPSDVDNISRSDTLIHSSVKIPNVAPFRILSIFTAAFVSGCLPFGIFMMAITANSPDDSTLGLYTFLYGLVCASLLLTVFTCIVAMIMAYPVIRNGLAKAVFISNLLVSIILLVFAVAIAMDLAVPSGQFLLTALKSSINPLYIVIMLALVLSSVFSFKLKNMY
jgi:hypothetical protein